MNEHSKLLRKAIVTEKAANIAADKSEGELYERWHNEAMKLTLKSVRAYCSRSFHDPHQADIQYESDLGDHIDDILAEPVPF